MSAVHVASRPNGWSRTWTGFDSGTNSGCVETRSRSVVMMARVNMVRDAGQLNHCMMPVLLVPERSRNRTGRESAVILF